MSLFNLKSAESCRFDEISMGEVMLRLDPGEGRIRTARSFRAWVGGGVGEAAQVLAPEDAEEALPERRTVQRAHSN